MTAVGPVKLEIILQKDPTAVQLNFEDGAMPPKARKETKHGVSALKSGQVGRGEQAVGCGVQVSARKSRM